MNDAHLVPVESPVTMAQSFTPSAELHRRLGTGVLAVLAAGGLAAASSFAELSGDGATGFTLADALAWAALVPLLVVLRTYLALAREAASFSLARSSQCLFGALVLANVLGLALLDVLPSGWQILAWVVVGVGILALMGAPFVAASEDAAVPAETPVPAEEAETTSRMARTGMIGGLAALVLVLKLLFKGGFAKLVLLRGAARLLTQFNLGLEALALLVVLPLAGAFLIWFGVSKIRLRGKLGGVAALLGWVEIVMVILFASLLTWFVTGLVGAVQQPGLAEKGLEELAEQASRLGLLIGVAVDLLWTALTAFLFVGVRNRYVGEQP